jgi:hypothetical protein
MSIFWSNFSEAPDIFKFMDLEEDLAALLGLKVDMVTRPELSGNRGNRIPHEVVSIENRQRLHRLYSGILAMLEKIERLITLS